MQRTSVYSFSILLFAVTVTVYGQDTIPVPMNIKLGADLFGPLYHIYDKNNRTLEGFLSVDIDTGKAVVIEGGYLDYRYSQYNYEYLNHGIFIRAGMDFNLLKPGTALGKYYAGVGLRYGLSIFTSEVPSFSETNYWSTVTGSVPPVKNVAHFLEASPGIRTQLFSHLEIGWCVRLRFLVYSNTSKNLKAIYIPGFGNATKIFSPGLNYYLMWSIPYRK